MVDAIDKPNLQMAPRPILAREGFASTEEAAQYLSLTRQSVSLMCLDGRIPARRFGRALRIPWSWLLEQEQRAREEVPPRYAKNRSEREPEPPLSVAHAARSKKPLGHKQKAGS
jgi:excisionase family DNA binding protein